jgi:hypothetical protein
LELAVFVVIEKGGYGWIAGPFLPGIMRAGSSAGLYAYPPQLVAIKVSSQIPVNSLSVDHLQGEWRLSDLREEDIKLIDRLRPERLRKPSLAELFQYLSEAFGKDATVQP